VGLNAVQGAAGLGAAHVLAVDPTATKRQAALEFGATEAFASTDEAAVRARALNPRVGGSHATIVCVGDLDAATVRAGFDATGKGGTLVLASFGHDPGAINVQLPGTALAGAEKRVQGTIFGSTTPSRDVPLLLRLHATGRLKLSELISATFPLDEIGQGYEDLRAGRILRGLIAHRG
jgi:S-(hydroxymethyl)glutathione dehydrogenase/alcohol dehydrogenase